MEEHEDEWNATELYPLYVQYMEDLAADAGRSIPVFPPEQFPLWLIDLSPHIRQRLLQNWHKTYAVVIEEGRREIAKMLGLQE
ncbi:hypothetical protein HYZ99_01415 [Candidatus Peregrinibacteria bacterium]|nr:hypothetical protein [Candidatus Peregrinibacteria bacterium]